MSFLRSMPRASLIDVFRMYPELARPLHELAQRLLRGPSPFTEGEREVLAAYVSGLNHCAFCEASHTAVAALYGHDARLIEHLGTDLECAAVAAIYEAGWDETALTHAALVCAFFNFMNRWVDGLGIQADPAVVKIAADMLHKKGYAAVVELLDRPPTHHVDEATGPARH